MPESVDFGGESYDDALQCADLGERHGQQFPPEPWLSTKAALTRVKKVIAGLDPLHDWIVAHVS